MSGGLARKPVGPFQPWPLRLSSPRRGGPFRRVEGTNLSEVRFGHWLPGVMLWNSLCMSGVLHLCSRIGGVLPPPLSGHWVPQKGLPLTIMFPPTRFKFGGRFFDKDLSDRFRVLDTISGLLSFSSQVFSEKADPQIDSKNSS